jgi:hypothetical protein
MDDSKLEAIIEGLDKEWEIPNGFFYRSRNGIMDEEGFFRVISLLEKSKDIISVSPNETVISRRFVKAIWFLPLFLSWQDERINNKGFPTDIYMGQWVARIAQLVEDILGSP